MTTIERPGLIVADGWKDYQLIDCGMGMKQEKWGPYALVRPDPQIIWPRTGGNGRWENWDGFYHRSETGGGKWEYRQQLPDHWTISYGELKFKIHPTSFKHTGLFPEQAVNWDWFTQKIKAARASGREVSVLNLFGYTGAASVAAAAAGASVCHVDASEGMVKWCRENAALSGLAEAPIRYITDDCLKFVRREIKRGRKYDAIIMDPPTYGRGSTGEMWKLEDHLWALLNECKQILTDQPVFVLINAYTARLSPTVVVNLLAGLMAGAGGRITGGEIGLPIQRDKKVLPCGIFGRWESGA
ncbi:class I SAM-dependent methyltransferase [Oleiharenicola lentus]|uniref:class I SAM-dependent methyltransferase n=1 Tax=Oleiharenicola lentus TaxID=2508720 RepID=UPI003F6706B2